ERPSFTLDPLFHAGAYYVQEASSMLIGHALKQVVDFDRNLRILDLCAAPGGKSTLLLSLMNDKSVLLSNEVIKTRVNILKENIHKWGNPNVMVSNHEAEDFRGLNGFFDVVLIDAPCSGEGLFRKDENAKKEWSPENVNLCSARQKKILSNTIDLLTDGGILLYSTCTYNAQENLDNVIWITEQFGCESIPIELPADWGVVELKESASFGYQCYPHLVKGEGFFFAVLRKGTNRQEKTGTSYFQKKSSLYPVSKSELELLRKWVDDPDSLSFYKKGNGIITAVSKAIEPDCAAIESALRRVSFGVEIGEFKGKDFIPSHELALSSIVSSAFVSIELEKNEALFYLKKELHSVDTDLRGWALAKYQGLSMGWMKILPNRINNYLPAHFRIRMDLDTALF
ncbi:MAG: methyltransferase RsmF C-terminal domain-like protein, partial [Saprospiraceae bacterium]